MNRPDSSTELGQIQRWFQSVITNVDGVEAGANSEEAQRLIGLKAGQLEQLITRSRALTAAQRLAIYANAYHTRLLECLGEVYPMLKRTLGDEAFDGLAFGYLQEYPSRSYTLNELGRHFPKYLEQTRPSNDASAEEPQGALDHKEETVLEQDWPDFLIDLARLEWAIYEVFDGEGVEGVPLLGADEVLGIPPDRWPAAKLKLVVCLQLLAIRFPVNDYFTAMRRAQEGEAIPMPPPREAFVALTRRNFVVRRYGLSRPQFELLKALKEGCSVGDALEHMLSATAAEGDDLTSELTLWFRNWTAEGFFQSVSLDGEAQDSSLR